MHCFFVKALFPLKMFCLDFGHVEKGLDQKDQVNFNIYDVTTWETSNCNTHIVQYLKK